MYIHEQLRERAASARPVRVGLVGAGKFGSMFLAQAPSTAGLEVSVIADLDPDRARAACRAVGWSDALLARTRFTDDALDAMGAADVDVVVEATGDPAAGIVHARAAFAAGKHIVMVNVEADVLAGPLLAAEARDAGVVYTMAYGDQPALTCEMVEWARVSGFEVVAAGKGTKYLPSYHGSTPDTVWEHYGLTAGQARAAGMNSRMFNSFLDGTKSAIEMAAIANATGLAPPPDGLRFPPCGRDDLAHVLRPAADGGQLHHRGQVEVVSSIERDGRPVPNDLRWGVYVVIEAPNDYSAACFRQYGMNTDATGRYSAMYKPFHLIGLELNVSILSAALLGRPTGATRDFAGDAVATAKRDLAAGETLDGEGGFTVYGKLWPARTSLERGALPIGLAHGVTLRRGIGAGEVVGWDDVECDPTIEAVRARREMEARFGTARRNARASSRSRTGASIMTNPNHYVPAGATVIEDTVVDARQPWSGRIDRGGHLVLVDLEGQQAIDFLCYNAHDPRERYHAPNTVKLQHNIYLGQGSVLWSVRAREMMTIVEDTCGGHDTIFGCCSFELDDVRYGRRNPRACQQNFESELARHGLDSTAVVPNVNFFMRVPVKEDGSADLADGWSKPGDHVTLRAEMDVLVVISNCPEALNPATGGNPTPVRAIRYRSS